MARANKLHIHCDVIHPESGEVLAERGDVLLTHTPRAQHILDVARAHHYSIIDHGKHIYVYEVADA